MKVITQFNSIESFETKRLYARKLESNDLDKFILMHTDKKVMSTLGGLRTDEETRENIEWNLNQWRENGFGLWMFFLKKTNEWIGRGGLRLVHINGKDEIEVGYALMTKFWRQGYATEIAKASLEIAFEVLRLNSLVGFTLITNQDSQHVLEKVGFQYECDFVHYNRPHRLYRIKNHRKVKLVDHHASWREQYSIEANKIKMVLGDSLKAIHHFGSTAIQNIPAKPVIDMMLEVNDLDEMEKIKNQLQSLGYLHFRRHIIPYHSFFVDREDDHMRFHLHILERGNPQVKRHLLFRDYLNQHPKKAKQYADLKLALAKKFPNDMNQYVMGKDRLVQELDRDAKIWARDENIAQMHQKELTFPMNVGKPLKGWTEQKLMQAIIANFNVHMTHFAQFINEVDFVRIPGFTLINSHLQDDTFNYVLDADFKENEVLSKISEIENYFKDGHIPFSWWVTPYDQPKTLSTFLEEKDYHLAETNKAMYFDLDQWDAQVKYPSSLKIIQATDEQTLRDFALVLANDVTAFKTYYDWVAKVLTKDDPIEFYVGYVNNKPVVRGEICYFGGVAGLYGLSTVPAERNKGYGTAMQQFRMRRAKEFGYHVAILLAAEEAYSLYENLGYKECGGFKEFKLKK